MGWRCEMRRGQAERDVWLTWKHTTEREMIFDSVVSRAVMAAIARGNVGGSDIHSGDIWICNASLC